MELLFLYVCKNKLYMYINVSLQLRFLVICYTILYHPKIFITA
jgi:hypothetical protein